VDRILAPSTVLCGPGSDATRPELCTVLAYRGPEGTTTPHGCGSVGNRVRPVEEAELPNARKVAFSPAGRILVTAGFAQTLGMWNLTDPRGSCPRCANAAGDRALGGFNRRVQWVAWWLSNAGTVDRVGMDRQGSRTALVSTAMPQISRAVRTLVAAASAPPSAMPIGWLVREVIDQQEITRDRW